MAQLIILYGSSPGAGKSTLASFLFEQYRLRGQPVEWLYEDDVLSLPLFESVVEAVQRGDRRLKDVVLETAVQITNTHQQSNKTLITDSIFPCFNWLIATGYYSDAELTDFSQKLAAILQSLNPLVVFLEVDQVTALQRAAAQRGQQWLVNLQTAVQGYGYQPLKAVNSLTDLASYFEYIAQTSRRLLHPWPNVVTLDAANNSLAILKGNLLALLEMGQEHAGATLSFPLDSYCGHYEATVETAVLPATLTITLSNNHLKIDSYWPEGCLLDPTETQHLFRLQATSYTVTFMDFSEDVPTALKYEGRGAACVYHCKAFKDAQIQHSESSPNVMEK